MYLLLKDNIIFVFLCFFSFCSCHDTQKYHTTRVIKPSFYYWKSEYSAENTINGYIENVGSNKLYVKFFDVDWNNAQQQATPIAPIQFTTQPPEYLDLVPTIFITNRTLTQLPDTLVDTLAARIGRRLTAMIKQNELRNRITEIQFDCDWSMSTKDKYFALLTAFQQLPTYQHLPISATIRLHQVKFAQKTGVPPVQRGMLMCYNMGELRELKTKNSILDINTLKQYIANLKQYPIPLDIGLPLFSWGVVFRHGKFEGLLNGCRVSDLDSISSKRQIAENVFVLTQPLPWGNTTLQVDDIIRVEEIDIELLQQTAQLINQYWQTDTAQVIFYHLDEKILTHYPTQDLLDVCKVFY